MTYLNDNSFRNTQGVICMSGSIYFRKDRKIWVVGWYHKPHQKQYAIYRYHGEYMYHKKVAQKCLSVVQGDFENSQKGLSSFRIEKYTGKGWTDVIDYFQEWLQTKEKKKPATYKGYKSYFKNWIKPFFKKNPVMLHQIQLDTLDKMLDSIKLSGKGKHNVMMCFHSFMDYAWRIRRITEIPPFPKRQDYNIVEPSIKWLPELRQMNIINAIPGEHRAIFLWLKYHLRRPSEACALHVEDYDIFNKIFTIRRSVSARKVVNSTKTGHEHRIPCKAEFIPIADKLFKESEKFFFQNPRARKNDKRYTNESLNILWKKACLKSGENIDLYSGLKHSSCSQYINEKGLSESELQMITDHARLDSVRRYAKTEVARKREILERKKLLTRIDKSYPFTGLISNYNSLES